MRRILIAAAAVVAAWSMSPATIMAETVIDRALGGDEHSSDRDLDVHAVASEGDDRIALVLDAGETERGEGVRRHFSYSEWPSIEKLLFELVQKQNSSPF
jgi:hypothetical protein